MAGVNDDGFWEDADVVAANDALISAAGGSWFAPGAAALGGDWPAQALADFQRRAEQVLQRGFGAGPLWVAKDPRFCLTLPLWLQACELMGITTRMCVASRSPLEVAHSLQRRDGFPVGYGLRLDLAYRRALLAALPAGALQVTYPDLINDPVAVMHRLAQALPLVVEETGLAASVRRDLRHHEQGAIDGVLTTPLIATDSLSDLAAAIDDACPEAEMITDLAAGFVARGSQLTELGEDHSVALATIAAKDVDIESLAAEKDAQIESLAAEHRQALATIAERDTQIAELDLRLQDTGDYLGRALATIAAKDVDIESLAAEKDAQIESLAAEKDAQIESLAAEHRQALATIAERDTQIAELDLRLQDTGDYLGRALATIIERDEQIKGLDSRLAEIGALHSHALEVIAEKDRVIDEIHNLPVLGMAVKAARRARHRSSTDSE